MGTREKVAASMEPAPGEEVAGGRSELLGPGKELGWQLPLNASQ